MLAGRLAKTGWRKFPLCKGGILYIVIYRSGNSNKKRYSGFPSPYKSRKKPLYQRVSGAADRIRTGDLVLTKDVLCLLSHGSIYAFLSKIIVC